MNFQDIKPSVRLKGALPHETVQVVSAQPLGEDAVDLVYRKDDGSLGQMLLYAEALAALSLETEELPWLFDADAAQVRLASEAYRIKLAHLFDPHLAIHTSRIQSLPHQISAVYGAMLPRQPLRFLLADDPGAGKTIMSGLLIKELKVRGDLNRCLIVSPGSLAEQWQDELYSLFQLEFEILTNDMLNSSIRGNAFIERPYLIARMDKLSRNEEIQEKLKVSEWDLIICDEAHKMSATVFGNEEKRTKRYNLGMLLSGVTRHFLLLTATPHNGKEDDFQMFLRLLDGDRFVGRNRSGQKTGVNDIMRRLVKEELLTFDEKRLFPERIAHTLKYELSDAEMELYNQVTEYVRTGFDKAQQVLDPKRAHAVGFALTILQRRLASSPEAIYQSLRRRRERLVELQSARDAGGNRIPDPAVFTHSFTDEDWEDLEEAPEEEINETEEQFLDEATAARTIAELQIEIHTLQDLELEAKKLLYSGVDKKWEQVSGTLQDDALMYGAGGVREKIIIFTEHRDTLHYLSKKIRAMLGNSDGVVTIQGGMRREERKQVEEDFKNDAAVSVLVATDAAGEGINLQRAHLMINYDLPWNPNRLEQRFGRIHRIGQRSICNLWNLVAKETREGEVFTRLFEKLELERESLGGKVFDVLGKVNFGDRPLRDLLIEAIRYGCKPEVRARLEQTIDGALDRKELERLLAERSLAGQTLGIKQVHEIREAMDRIEAHRLQPHFIESFFIGAFERLKGQIRKRADHRYTLPHVPRILRESPSPAGVPYPISKSYEAVTFEKQYIHVDGQINDAALICPGHPLLSALIDEVLGKSGKLLKRGTVFIDDTGGGRQDRLLFYIEDMLEDGRRDTTGRPVKASHRIHFVEIYQDGTVRSAGLAPYLDYTVPAEAETPLIQRLLKEKAWWDHRPENLARDYAVKNLMPGHLKEIRDRRIAYVDKVEQEVKNRLNAEIVHWDTQAGIMKDRIAQGKTNARLNAERFQERVKDLELRQKRRLEELALERNIVPKPPVVLGGAWIVPRSMIQALSPGQNNRETTPEGRDEVERTAMETVMALERELNNTPVDVSRDNLGYDIESKTPGQFLRFIEVKGRLAGEKDITVTHNEMRTASNSPDTCILAVVIVDGSKRTVTYYTHWIDSGPSFAEVNRRLDLNRLRQAARVSFEREITL
ncbi:putative RNA polymerase-associated protein RapA [Hollandina sp. SP2]